MLSATLPVLAALAPLVSAGPATEPTQATAFALRGSSRTAVGPAASGANSSSASSGVPVPGVAPLVTGPGAWDLNGGAGPWCDPGTASGREAGSCRKAGDRGWDPCCAWENCNIFDAVWDSTGPRGDGTWCWRSDFDQNGGTCWNGQAWDFWTGGTVFDWCPCNDGDVNCEGGLKQMCISTSDNGEWWDWRQCYDWTGDDDCWKNLLQEKCSTDHSMDMCYNGFIQAPSCGGGCPDFMRSETDETGLEMCVPEWS